MKSIAAVLSLSGMWACFAAPGFHGWTFVLALFAGPGLIAWALHTAYFAGVRDAAACDVEVRRLVATYGKPRAHALEIPDPFPEYPTCVSCGRVVEPPEMGVFEVPTGSRHVRCEQKKRGGGA